MRVRSLSVGTTFILFLIFSAGNLKAMSQTFEEKFKQDLQASLSEVAYNDHEDNVTRRNTLGFPRCSGKERFLNGSTGIAEINVRQEGSSFEDLQLIADVSLPYSGSYNAKNFIGVACEYRRDPKKPSGFVKFTVTKTFFSQTLKDVIFQSESHGGHDAGRMSREALQEDILGRLKN